jgi:S1-C subfamily serine protease
MVEQMNPRTTLLPAVFALVLAAACGGSDSPAAPSSPTPNPAQPVNACGALGGTAIVNGAQCAADSSSVIFLSLRREDNQALASCSGTIIAPRAVLTAAHCVDDEEIGVVQVFLGSGQPIVAESRRLHPNYRTNDSSFDVAVVLLRDEIGRAAMPVLASRDPRVGESVVLAGWGRDLFNQGSTLRAGATTISAVRDAVIETQFSQTASAVCSGDSGGAMLVNEGGTWAVAGVTSATSSQGCLTGTNFFANLRHPATAAFISDVVPNRPSR